ncbi:hypothetical protein KI688_006716 [Linnemannia hyalina]|uniref:F-box domain-containing protein n=1 Tax=Linnemannia hyalina TaxID=64524 RepID=A0A9P7XJE6_9FUNG|nr:hypothetical protein KI688_006716 [Linnemannia hyalina]
MEKTTVSSHPLEVFDMIAIHLDPKELVACVQVNHDWSRTFARHLWREVRIRPLYECPNSLHTLKKYGHFVQAITCENYEMVELLATHIQACTNLLELKILEGRCPYDNDLSTSSQNAPAALDLEPFITILQHAVHLRSLTLDGALLDEKNPNLGRVFDCIPESLKILELGGWDPINKDRSYHLEDDSQQLVQTDDNDTESDATGLLTPLPHLEKLVFRNYAIDYNKQTLRRLLKRCPNVETIRLEDMSTVYHFRFFSSLLFRHCPKVVHLHLLEWYGSFDGDLAALLDASQAGWRTLGFPRSRSNSGVFGPLSSAALLRNAPTLENVRLDSAYDVSSSTVQKLFSAAPNLKRFDAIARDRSHTCDCQLDARDIVGGSDWVCTSLESLKIRIGGIPRPDILARSNLRPFDDDDELHKGTMEDSRRIQRRVYSQLGRLTKLKQLVLGHDDVECNNECMDRESYTEGEYYDRDYYEVDYFDRDYYEVQNGLQHECLEMTVESGVELLKDLSVLKVLELEARAHGKVSSEYNEREYAWKNEFEAKLDTRYQDHFWTRLGYLPYY